MTQSFDRLVERQIQKALADGQLTGLQGEGKPLPDRSGEAFTDMATAVATRIMAEAGALPEEFRIKKLLEAAKLRYREAASDAERRLAMALISDLELRYNIAVEARRRFMGH
ncbi:DnaJ family domain-containing protein [Litorisediminicola beolgyonensis]|uniref:DnaJ family domain-containing protein n=1 Tax=Litorisediminicola beolgyonensis TaxID=1173614 RepID=A0ABW3ZNK0_9RHOB